MSEKPRTPGDEPDLLIPAVSELVDAVLGLAVTITRSAARATDSRAHSGENTASAGAVDEIVRNGAAAIAGIVRMATGGISGKRNEQSAHPAGAYAPPFPMVQAGGTLRMPLVIENPSPESTGPLEFTALSVTGPEGSEGLEPAQIRCVPRPLVIAARDFEKLTVLIDTTVDTPQGRHRVSVGAEGTPFATVVEFDVVS
jgi:hypothetical protein